MKKKNYIFLVLALTCSFLFNANAEKNSTPLSESEITGCDDQLAYWSLDACESFTSNNSNYDYSELTAATNTPSGFSSVNATILSNNDQHSCVYGQSGTGVCHDIRDACSWIDNAGDVI